MFHPLPAQTVLEAKRRSRWATRRLFLLLVLLYVGFFNLMLMTAFLGSGASKVQDLFTYIPTAAYVGTAISIGLACVHFFWARRRPLQGLLDQIGAVPFDPKDKHHTAFRNLVGEAEAATGIRGIRAVILPDPGCNAFSLQDGAGNCAIGATEGILTRLTRPELSAVVAHEAAHLVHEDARLVTTACFLFGVFAKINETIGRALSNSSSYSSSRRRGSLPGVFLLLWIISGVAYLVTRLVSMAISREREFYADSDGVAMCKDPLSLAEGLSKIAQRYRGSAPEAYSALFILNPALSAMDEGEGFLENLFSTHPPVGARIRKLLAWAKLDLKSFQERAVRQEKQTSRKEATASAVPSTYMVHEGENWLGPYTPLQLLSLGSLGPATWVCPAGTQEVKKASDALDLLPLFEEKVQGSRTGRSCPRCKVPLLSLDYEGIQVEHCSFCGGHLFPRGVLERIVTREERTFSEEEIQRAKQWKAVPGNSFRDLDQTPETACPGCGGRMARQIHSSLTRVMIDRCNDACGSVWFDGGELETIQILVEEARQGSHG